MHLTPFSRAFSLRILLAIALSLVGFTAKADIHPGKEYELLSPPQVVETGKKIEVLEIFPTPARIVSTSSRISTNGRSSFPRMSNSAGYPAIFRDDWTPFAKVFYTFEAMG